MKYKLIGMDFDGTLLNDDKKVSKITEEKLKALKEEGYKIVGVTARTLAGAKGNVPLEMFNYVIINNGVSIYDVERKTEDWLGYISQDEAKEIIEIIKSKSDQIDIISENNYYTLVKKKNSPLPFIIDIDKVEEIDETIARMNIFLKSCENVQQHYEELTEKFPNINCFIMQDSGSDYQWLIINPKGINKSETLKYLGEKLNISLDEMIFFGDGLNDLEAMQEVGMSVAMGNALAEVKKHANEVTDTNNNDGIAKFLSKTLI